MPALQLGDVLFNLEELPEQINFGGEQTLAIRKFPGGGLDIQALGAFDDPIQWEGIFWYAGALQRCVQVGMMRTGAQPVQLTVGQIIRTVMVSKFTYQYQNDYYIPYQIELQPVASYGLGATVNGMALQQSSIQLGTTQAADGSETVVTPGITVTVGPVTTDEAMPAQPQLTHIIQSMDTLWGMAVNYYGDGSLWTRIATANNIKDPGNLIPGTTIVIPGR